MSDDSGLVERIRQTHKEITESDGGECDLMAMFRQAADTIERLTRERADLTDGLRGMSAARDEARALAADRRERIMRLHKRIAALEEAVSGFRSFVAVMFGRGPDCKIPETITTPLGVPVKIGDIMAAADRALAGGTR